MFILCGGVLIGFSFVSGAWHYRCLVLVYISPVPLVLLCFLLIIYIFCLPKKKNLTIQTQHKQKERKQFMTTLCLNRAESRRKRKAIWEEKRRKRNVWKECQWLQKKPLDRIEITQQLAETQEIGMTTRLAMPKSTNTMTLMIVICDQF